MPNVRSRTSRADAQRLTIIQVAIRTLNHHGLRGAGIREIARAAQLATGNIYYYFRDKEELLFACQEYAIDQLLEVLASAQGRPDSDERLSAIIDGHLRVVMDGGCVLWLDVERLPKMLSKKLIAKREKYERGVRDLLAEGQREGAVRAGDHQLQTQGLLGALNWVSQWYREGEHDREEVIAGFRVQQLRGLSLLRN